MLRSFKGARASTHVLQALNFPRTLRQACSEPLLPRRSRPPAKRKLVETSFRISRQIECSRLGTFSLLWRVTPITHYGAQTRM